MLCAGGPLEVLLAQLPQGVVRGRFLGDPELKTLQMYVEDINKQGGVNGRQLQLVHYDDGSDANKANGFGKRLIEHDKVDVIIVDECQFLTGEQIDQLRELVDRENLPVLCFGLRTDFQTKLFPGSRRLFELADSITEIKTICDCGRKATTNARISPDGYVVTEGDQVFLGGNDSYIAMCHKCYQDYINEHRKVELLHGTERDPQ